ncbi:1078_t:CDS:2 [Ambispora gerdemannii]|uniref:1078_t:CDS:1 n=1 Tax=Ambispora gerdemannii TaxID=144530 RepID=A0A9N9A4S2_9GLOM|nr:1078_t:CDS:2 [Ambispora gerdemannii]
MADIKPQTYEMQPTALMEKETPKFQRPTSISFNLINDTMINLSFKYSDNCKHDFVLEPYTSQFINKNLNNIGKKTANRYILFRSCFSNAASKKLLCAEKSCPLSTLSSKDNQLFISQLSSHINKEHKNEIFSVFSPLYDKLKSFKKGQKYQSMDTLSRSQYTPERRQRGYSDSAVLKSTQLGLFDTPASTFVLAYAPENLQSLATHTLVGSSSETSSDFPYFESAYSTETIPDPSEAF